MHKPSLFLTATLLMTLSAIASEQDDLKEKPYNIQKNQVSPAVEGLDKRIERLQQQRKMVNAVSSSNVTSELATQLDKRKQKMGEVPDTVVIPHFGPTIVDVQDHGLTLESINENLQLLQSLGLDGDRDIQRQISMLQAQRNNLLQGNSNSAVNELAEEVYQPSIGSTLVELQEPTIESINESLQLLQSLGLDGDRDIQRQISMLQAQRNNLLQGNSNSSVNELAEEVYQPSLGPTIIDVQDHGLTLESINESLQALQSLGLDGDRDIQRQISTLQAQRNNLLQGNNNSSLNN